MCLARYVYIIVNFEEILNTLKLVNDTNICKNLGVQVFLAWGPVLSKVTGFIVFHLG